MREIKFRAWDGKKWLKDYLVSPYGSEVVCSAGKLSWKGVHGVEPMLMQYTGLKDKNGREIYEGDVLSFENQTSVVEYLGGGFWVKDGERNWIPAQHLREVIGNIYENPELLSDKRPTK